MKSILNTPPPINFAAIMFSIITIYIIYHNKNSRTKVIKLITNKSFVIGLIPVIGWSVYSLQNNDNSPTSIKTQTATKHAIIALIIAILAELHLSIAPFWLVWIASYYLDI